MRATSEQIDDLVTALSEQHYYAMLGGPRDGQIYPRDGMNLVLEGGEYCLRVVRGVFNTECGYVWLGHNEVRLDPGIAAKAFRAAREEGIREVVDQWVACPSNLTHLRTRNGSA